MLVLLRTIVVLTVAAIAATASSVLTPQCGTTKTLNLDSTSTSPASTGQGWYLGLNNAAYMTCFAWDAVYSSGSPCTGRPPLSIRMDVRDGSGKTLSYELGNIFNGSVETMVYEFPLRAFAFPTMSVYAYFTPLPCPVVVRTAIGTLQVASMPTDGIDVANAISVVPAVLTVGGSAIFTFQRTTTANRATNYLGDQFALIPDNSSDCSITPTLAARFQAPRYFKGPNGLVQYQFVVPQFVNPGIFALCVRFAGQATYNFVSAVHVYGTNPLYWRVPYTSYVAMPSVVVFFGRGLSSANDCAKFVPSTYGCNEWSDSVASVAPTCKETSNSVLSQGNTFYSSAFSTTTWAFTLQLPGSFTVCYSLGGDQTNFIEVMNYDYLPKQAQSWHDQGANASQSVPIVNKPNWRNTWTPSLTITLEPDTPVPRPTTTTATSNTTTAAPNTTTAAPNTTTAAPNTTTAAPNTTTAAPPPPNTTSTPKTTATPNSTVSPQTATATNTTPAPPKTTTTVPDTTAAPNTTAAPTSTTASNTASVAPHSTTSTATATTAPTTVVPVTTTNMPTTTVITTTSLAPQATSTPPLTTPKVTTTTVAPPTTTPRPGTSPPTTTTAGRTTTTTTTTTAAPPTSTAAPSTTTAAPSCPSPAISCDETAPFCCTTDGQGFCCSFGCADPSTGATCANSPQETTTAAPTTPSPPGVTTTAAPPTTAAPTATTCPKAPSGTSLYSSTSKSVITLNLTTTSVPPDFLQSLSTLMCVPQSTLSLGQPQAVDGTTQVEVTLNCGFDDCSTADRMNYILWLAQTNLGAVSSALSVSALRQGSISASGGSSSSSSTLVVAAPADNSPPAAQTAVIGLGAAVGVLIVCLVIFAIFIAVRRRRKQAAVRRNNEHFAPSPDVQRDASPYMDRRPRHGNFDDVDASFASDDPALDVREIEVEMEPDIVVEITPSKPLVH